MPSVSLPASSYRAHPSLRRRAASLALSVGLVLLVVLMLLRLGVIGPVPREKPAMPVTFQMLPPSAAPAGKTEARKKAASASGAAPPSTPTPQPVKPPPPPAIPSAAAPKMLSLSKDEFAATDIGALPSHHGEGEGDAGTGKDSGAVYGPGEGPGGERLYNVAWYREPTDAELSTYLPKRAPGAGSATVACRMIERYHVENCRELDETPLGSGYARTLRLAAWQFLVRPPRVGNKAMIGSWVRIHVDFSTRRPPEAPASLATGPGKPPPDDDQAR